MDDKFKSFQTYFFQQMDEEFKKFCDFCDEFAIDIRYENHLIPQNHRNIFCKKQPLSNATTNNR